MYNYLIDNIDTIKVDVPMTDFEIKFLTVNREQILELMKWKKKSKAYKIKKIIIR
jgi:hypothetical protein